MSNLIKIGIICLPMPLVHISVSVFCWVCYYVSKELWVVVRLNILLLLQHCIYLLSPGCNFFFTKLRTVYFPYFSPSPSLLSSVAFSPLFLWMCCSKWWALSSATPSPPATVHPCPLLTVTEEEHNLYSASSVLSFIQSTTRRAYQQVLEVLDENPRRWPLNHPAIFVFKKKSWLVRYWS